MVIITGIRENKKKIKDEAMEKELKEFEKAEQAKLKAIDQHYANDLDTAAKRKEIRQQMELAKIDANQNTLSETSTIMKEPTIDEDYDKAADEKYIGNISYAPHLILM